MKEQNMLVQLPLKISLRNDASFKTFVAEQELIAQTLSSLQQPDKPQYAGCYYFYGPEGVGKTHLLQAACRFYSEKQLQSVFFPLMDKGLPLIADVLVGLEVTDLVCLDGVEAILGDPAWEKALANLVAKSKVQGHRVLLAGQMPIRDWPMVTDALRAEVFSIMPIPLAPITDKDSLILALQRHAINRGFELSLDVTNFLIKRFSLDLQELLAVLQLLEQASLAEKRRMTLPFVKDVLAR
ncbi:DnaA regulatory inactivator Hda [Thiomicrospira sp. R3]|uniref:HdaA/DnaA family protein n=1 Tax=Thiomicrospira sp. R3 TaxID=3035472 RepID=UPI00259B5BB4|nr:DnaA regulatory inactivator Hda [Thiomicrospira sp. R3]WFE68732.1 DnaA regulatory inactivator Hda [Thiomicrospira sp. R3]